MKKPKTTIIPVNNNLNSTPNYNAEQYFGLLFTQLNAGESTNIQLTKNKNNSATMRCSEKGLTLVNHESGNNVFYIYKPKK